MSDSPDPTSPNGFARAQRDTAAPNGVDHQHGGPAANGVGDPVLFARGQIDGGAAEGREAETAPAEEISQALGDAAKRADIPLDEVVSLTAGERLAILLDAPRSAMLLQAADRDVVAPEEILIRALDRFFDNL